MKTCKNVFFCKRVTWDGNDKGDITVLGNAWTVSVNHSGLDWSFLCRQTLFSNKIMLFYFFPEEN